MEKVNYYKISNLSEYICVLKEVSTFQKVSLNQNMLFRGESKDFHSGSPKFISSAFRSDREPIEGYEVAAKIPFLENVETFKHEIYGEIDNDIRNHFLAYSQHHGIRTNLIDVTSNPLIALYFSSERYNEEEGYVYVIDTPLLDVTDIFQRNDEENIGLSTLF